MEKIEDKRSGNLRKRLFKLCKGLMCVMYDVVILHIYNRAQMMVGYKSN